MVFSFALFTCAILGWQVLGADRFGPHSFEAREAARLRRHFAVVERELLGRDVSRLTSAQRLERANLVHLLRRYAREGAFPRNIDFPEGAVPYFRDSRGNLCAMAFLIAASGRSDIVDHVARTRNNAYVPALVDEPGLSGWLDQHGLTLAEAARIQPTYGPQPDPNPSDGAIVASVAAGGISIASMVWNARSMDRLAGHRVRTLVGLAASGVNIGLGVNYLGKDQGTKQGFGALNLIVGTAAAIVGARALFAKHQVVAIDPNRLSVTPVVIAGRALELGFNARLRF
jgi:hypothetical protein